jgi:proteasome accessory factor C
VAERPGGRLRVVMRAADPRFVVRLVLRLGGAAAVVEPASLAAEVATAAREALAPYTR